MLLVRRFATSIALALIPLLAGPALLAAPAMAAACPRTSLPDVEAQVMCVSCGVPLNLANSPQADGERRLIRALIAQCRDATQIKAAMKAEYGPNVLSLPSGGGFSRAVWIVPAAAALIGIAAVALVGARWRRRPPPSAAAGGWSTVPPPPHSRDAAPTDVPPPTSPVGAPSDAESRRLDEDLSHFDP